MTTPAKVTTTIEALLTYDELIELSRDPQRFGLDDPTEPNFELVTQNLRRLMDRYGKWPDLRSEREERALSFVRKHCMEQAVAAGVARDSYDLNRLATEIEHHIIGRP